MTQRPPRAVRALSRGRDLLTAEGRRRLALRRVTWEQQRMRPARQVWAYRNTFAQGFLATKGESTLKPHDDWLTLRLGPWHVQLDPLLEHQMAQGEHTDVLILGQVFDENGPARRHRIAGALKRTLDRAVGAEDRTSPDALARSRDALDEAIAWLSGRYLVFVRRGDALDVYGDPIATRLCYWHAAGGRVAVASHSALLAELVGGLPSTRVRWVLGHPDYASPAGKYLPALITPHDGVGQLHANGRLQVSAEGAVEHRRFFPRADREERPEAEVFAEFRDELRQQVRNWISVAPLTVLTLTGGGDSRAILEAGLVDLQRAKAIAMTYHPFHNPNKSTYGDYASANRRAAEAGLRHLVLDVSQSLPPRMADLYRTTFPTWNRYSALASALYHGSPARAATIFGVGGAIITGMITDRSVTELTPELLARKYAYSRFAQDPELHSEFARWMEFTEFSADHLRGYDFYDFFHWEHRMSKWGAAGYSEYDLATLPAPVLSSRRLLTAALALPFAARRDGRLYRSIRYESS